MDSTPCSSALREDSRLAVRTQELRPVMESVGSEPWMTYPYVPKALTDPSHAL